MCNCVNLGLLTINCQLKLDSIVDAQYSLEIVINVTWRNWEFNFILQCPTLSILLPLQCQNRPNTLKFESIMSSDAIFINLKSVRYIVSPLKDVLCIFDLFIYLNSIPYSATM